MTTINSVGNSLAGTSGSGAFVGATSPTLITPASLGVQQQDLNMNDHFIQNLGDAISYTPVVGASSGAFGSTVYISNVGQYMQFGNLVIFVAYVQLSTLTLGTASGTFYITLPVPVGGPITVYQPAVVLSTTTVFTGPSFFQPIPSTSFCQFVNYVSSNSLTIIPPSAIGNSGSCRFSGIYFTS